MIDEMKRKRNVGRKKIIRNETEDIFCFCASIETRFEDFTLRSYGDELTRNIELRVCLDCGEQQIDGRTALDMESKIKAKVLALANERFEVPDGHIYLRYYDDVDLMEIGYSNNKYAKTKGDVSKGLVYNFDYKGKIASVEIMDFYGKFVEEDE